VREFGEMVARDPTEGSQSTIFLHITGGPQRVRTADLRRA